MRLVLIRHCEPAPEARGRCYGALDFGLSDAGRAAAAAIRVPWALDAVVSSPRRRALETAAPLATAHGVDVTVDDRLRELDFGDLEGLTYEECERTRPELYRRWMEAPTTVEFPGGESYALLRRRVLDLVAELRLRGGVVAAVTHGGPIRAVVAASLRIPDDAIFRIAQDYGAMTVVDLGEEPVVQVVNGTCSPPGP